MIANLISNKYNLNIHGIFSYGSSVYENKLPDDLDFIVVTDDPHQQETFTYNGEKIEVTFYSISEFKKDFDSMQIHALECFYLPLGFNLINDYNNQVMSLFSGLNEAKEYGFNQEQKQTLRQSISAISSNSFVKAKKKIIVEDDFCLNTSMKSLWHSLRIIDFGTQIAERGRINNFQSSNNLYLDIKNDYDKFNDFENKELFWDFLFAKYKPVFNHAKTKFKTLCPK